MNGELHPLPAQAADVPWPGADWPEGGAIAAVDEHVGAMFDREDAFGATYAVVVVQHGRIIAERYGGALPSFEHPPEPVVRDTPLLSWSMAKSILHCAVGLLVAEGRLDPNAPVPIAAWSAPGDARAAITLDQLLCMRDGLDFTEDYVDAGVSDVIEMLFGAGQHDVAGFASARALKHEPGSTFNYSSGTSNIVSGIVASAVGPGEPYERFLQDRIFGPLGMRTAHAKFDAAGTFVGSSYVYAQARDFARFGTLYLRGGVWAGEQLVPAAWVDHGRTPRSVDPTDGRIHGAHWWVVGDDRGSFWASGYEGQSTLVCPALDAIVVRLGRSTEAHSSALFDWRLRVLDALA